jgi:hypothetical protein
MLKLRVEPTIELTEIHQNLYKLLTKENSFENDEQLKLYAIVNASVLTNIDNYLDLIDINPKFLLKEKYVKLLGSIVPLLIDISKNDELLLWLIENGYGTYGVQFIYSRYEINEVAKSLQALSLLEIQLEVNGEYRESLFHFYDNRTFHPYMEIVDYKTSKRFFELIEFWLSPEPIYKHIITVFKMKEDGLYFNNLNLNKTKYHLNKNNFLLTNASEKVNDELFTHLFLSREELNHFDNINAYRYTRDVAYSIQSQLEKYKNNDVNRVVKIVQPLIIQGFKKYNLTQKMNNFYYVVLELLEKITQKNKDYLETENSEYLKKIYLEESIKDFFHE